MNMLRTQAAELRKMAAAMSERGSAIGLDYGMGRELVDAARMMREAADTIEGLRKQVAKCQIAELKADYDTSRHFDMFGTPERAARTLSRFCADCFCGDCATCGVPEWADYTRDYDALLEWLKGDA